MVTNTPRTDIMIWNLLILSAAVFIVANILPGIYIKNFFTAIVVAVVYSIVQLFDGMASGFIDPALYHHHLWSVQICDQRLFIVHHRQIC